MEHVTQELTCQNCKSRFVIEPDDFSFYAKIKVQPPTFCPGCRLQRRMLFRNEKTLYHRRCSLCNKNILAVYSDKAVFPVYCESCWFSDQWDGLQYGKELDLSRPFLTQFHELQADVPRLALEVFQSTNSEYANFVWNSKDVYLSNSVLSGQQVMYCRSVYYSSYIADSSFLHHSERCYQGLNSQHCSNSRFFVDCQECLDSAFLFDCVGCSHCFMSSNLRQKSYVFRDQPVSPEEYRKLLSEIDLGSFRMQQDLIREFEELRLKSLHCFAIIKKSVNAVGNNIVNSKNAFSCFDVLESENVKFFFQGLYIKDSMDLYGAGDHAELLYEGVNVGLKDMGIYFSAHTFNGCSDVYYCDYCRGGKDLFGCIGLRSKEYCILNKQYGPEEYKVLISKIRKHMEEMPYEDKQGRTYSYGEFFPTELSPFAYDEAVVQEYFPLTKESATAQGYRWQGSEAKKHQATISSFKLPDHIRDVSDNICEEVIGCEHEGHCSHQCTTAFKITPQELGFYRQMNLPLPRACSNCRHYMRMSQRNPLKLWLRQCMCDYKVLKNVNAHACHATERCPNKFQTSYAPDRPEIVYCEECYQAEIA